MSESTAAGEPASTSESIVIIGSRLQALILWTSGAALGIGLWDRLGWLVLPLVVVLLVWGATVMVRRTELRSDGVEVRRITGTRRGDNGTFEADAGHRYLTIRFDGGDNARIEIPVEIRPEVRTWASRHPGEVRPRR